ncbi:Spy/CpxP family protein refolding chaperone [Bradyrhizobium sp.]|uniref:Spy/CpxP family protein refolding chaperone n=2 Tax=Bradyrhizobium sp. TaxID=376 RepID=UPI001ECE795A|nr:Spy/CpxP family protein refolding chaperone [Bradyrhizobium sp.]MBV9982505.1 Spy/CpxP family protein refolding chaperone [Bradyrhizobium sp.]
MPRLTSKLRARWRLCVVVGVSALFLFNAPRLVDAQGLIKGVEQGAREGNRAAGPVGGVLGGAIGGVVGAVTGVFTGAGGQTAQPAPKDNARDTKAGAAGSKGTKVAKENAKENAKDTSKAAKQVQVLTQEGTPQVTADQIVTNSDAYIERIKKELNLTPDQEKNWSGFSSAMHYLGHNGAERLNLRLARAKRDPPDDIIEQMRNEAQFLIDRAADQRNVADAAEPLFASLDDKQKEIFIEEMVRLSHERGLD